MDLAMDGVIGSAIWSWLSMACPEATVIWERQSGERPSTPFATLRILHGPDGTGFRDEVGFPQAAAGPEVRAHREFTISCNYFGYNAMSRMGDAVTALSLPSVLETLRTAGLAFVNAQGVVDLTEVFNEKYEGRAQADLVFRASEVITDLATGYADHMRAQGELDGAALPEETFPS